MQIKLIAESNCFDLKIHAEKLCKFQDAKVNRSKLLVQHATDCLFYSWVTTYSLVYIYFRNNWLLIQSISSPTELHLFGA